MSHIGEIMRYGKNLVFGVVAFLLFSMISVGVGYMPDIISGETDVSIFAGGSGTEDDPYQINNIEQLQNMSKDLTAHYELIDDIDASTTEGWNDRAGFEPVGEYEDPADGIGEPPNDEEDEEIEFTGTLKGNDHEIKDLHIDRPYESFVGLFGAIGEEAFVINIGLVNVSIAGESLVGGLVGINLGTVENTHVKGNINGSSFGTGGLVGMNNKVGRVQSSYATGAVSGERWVGGLVGHNALSSTVENSHAGGEVTGESTAGGLVGYNRAFVKNSFATGNITGLGWSKSIGGLIGHNDGSVSNSYAVGNVTGDKWIGGLVGFNIGTIEYSYSVGKVSGTEDTGGLVGTSPDKGVKQGTVLHSFWDVETSEQDDSEGGTGKSTSEMTKEDTFTDAGWDFEEKWDIIEDETYPYLQWQEEDTYLRPAPSDDFNWLIWSTIAAITIVGAIIYVKSLSKK